MKRARAAAAQAAMTAAVIALTPLVTAYGMGMAVRLAWVSWLERKGLPT